MQLGDVLPVQRDALDLARVAGVRACAGDDRAERDQQDGRGDQHPHHLLHRLADEGARLGVSLAGALPHQRGDGDERGGEEEVGRDRIRVEAHQHDDAAEHRVAHDDPELRPAQPGQAAPVRLPRARRDDRPADRRAQHVRQHAVAELDDAMDAHRAGRGERVVGALGPGRAAEARTRQPYGTAGDHDHHRHDERGQSRPPHRPLRRGPAFGDEGERVAHGGYGVGSGHVWHGLHARPGLVHEFTRGGHVRTDRVLGSWTG